MTRALIKPIAEGRDRALITANSKMAVKHMVADAIELLDSLKRGDDKDTVTASTMVSSVVLFPLRHALCLQINIDLFNNDNGPASVSKISSLLKTLSMVLQSSNRHTRAYLRVGPIFFNCCGFSLYRINMLTLGFLFTQGRGWWLLIHSPL